MNESTKNDTGEGINANTSSWTFEGISETFEKHIKKSVPLYFESHELITGFTDFFVQKGSSIIDIGASTGNLIGKISDRHKTLENIKFYLIDEIEEMVEFSRKSLLDEKGLERSHHFHFINKSITDFNLPENSSIIISNYTMQFISPAIRQVIIDKIYKSLAWGSAFFFFEKMNGADARFNDILVQNYEDFKIKNGYSVQEIKAKQKSLRGVLRPFSLEGNIDLLKRAGFVDYEIIFSYGQFKGILAIK